MDKKTSETARVNWLSDTKHEIIAIKSDGRCYYCGCELARNNITVDHKHPKKRGGSNHIDNLVYACRSCNCRKGPKLLETFRLSESYRLRGIPQFNDQQLQYLESIGVDRSLFEPELIKFYGEAL